ncbi:MAG: acetylxylan esterase [Saprospiraceae bacterium]|nr:acetylxylan esterase [Saprospiraceae bacterium]
MKKKLVSSSWLVLMIILAFPVSLFSQQSQIKVFDTYQGRTGTWMKYQNLDQSWYKHLHHLADRYLDERAEKVNACETKEAWLKRKKYLQEQLLASVGGLPEKTPLHPEVIEILERKTFTVEKLLYQSLPGYYVTACLFLPKKRQQPAPAVIYCSGHTREGFRSPTYQGVILNLVEKGFVVLAFDPIGQGERYQYLDAEGQPNRGGPTNEHSYAGVQAMLTGASIARYMINDGIRAVDYLLSRPEVDSKRIGITGRSGGGTQSAYIAAFDSRILAVAPENYITSFRRIWQSNGPQDAEQNFLAAMQRGLEHADLLAIRVPKPTLVLTTTRDIFSIQGARETRAEVEEIYRLYEAEDQLLWAEDDAGHQSTKNNREAMYGFFQRILQLPGDSTDHEVEVFTEEELRISRTGQVRTAVESKAVFDVNKEEFLAQEKDTQHTEALRSAIQESLQLAPSISESQAVFTGRILRDGYRIEKYFLEFSDEHYPIPFLHIRSASASTGLIVLYLNSQGKSAALDPGGEIEQLLEAGFQVVAPDLLNVGELRSTFRGDSHIEGVDYNLILGSSLVGTSLPALQAEDLVHLLDYLQDKRSKSSAKVIVMADRGLCTPLLHVAAIRNDFSHVLLKEPLVSLQNLLDTRRYLPELSYEIVPNLLNNYDLSDLMSSTQASSLTVINPRSAAGILLTEAAAKQAYQRVRDVYGEAGSQRRFLLKVGRESVDWKALFR